MNKFRIITIACAILALSASIALGQKSRKVSTIYTDLSAEKCKTVESSVEGTGRYRGICPGVGGYKIELLEGDIRQSLNIIAPNGEKSELDFVSNVSSAFSSVGEKAEWRVRRNGENVEPFALIVRYNSSDESGETQKTNSRLIIIKIQKSTACITDIVEPISNANLKAREMAYASENKPCKFKARESSEKNSDSVESINAYAKTIDAFTKKEGGPNLVIADVSDYNKDDKAKWKKFASEKDFEKSTEDSYTTAFIWKKDGKPLATNFTYSSPSGDWAQYMFYVFREDGSVAKATRDLRTFMGDIMVVRTYYYDQEGNLLKETKQFRDLATKKFVKASNNFQDIDVDIYKNIKELPFVSMLNSNNDESSFVPKGWKLEEKTTGDLNGDKLADSILQIKNEQETKDDESDRKLIILFKTRSGNYTKAAESDSVIRCSSCGGMLGGGPANISVKNGVLLIDQMYGSRNGVSYLHRLRYEAGSKRFRLIGEDVNEFDRLELTSETTSTNYLTGKQVIKNSKGGENDVKESVKYKTVSKKKRYLSDINYNSY